ncbi:MAG: hypothetical protein ABL894_11415 [Hyphomicrobium sp.]
MFKIQRQPAWPPALDLSTVKETIAYMEGDLRRVPGLEAAVLALKTAIREIEAAEQILQPKSYSLIASKFIARR